jgi:hypothetical protein
MQAFQVMLSHSEANMKKSIQVCIIVILAIALAFSVFAVTKTSREMAYGTFCPLVGWNGRGINQCSPEPSPVPVILELAYSPIWPEFTPVPVITPGPIVNPGPVVTPLCIGWNG